MPSKCKITPQDPDMQAPSRPLSGCCFTGAAVQELLRSTPHTPHTHSRTNGAACYRPQLHTARRKFPVLGKGPSITTTSNWSEAQNFHSIARQQEQDCQRGGPQGMDTQHWSASAADRRNHPPKNGRCTHCCCSNGPRRSRRRTPG